MSLDRGSLHFDFIRGETFMPVTQVNIDTSQFKITPRTSEDFELAHFTGQMANGETHRFTDTEMRTLHSMLQKWGTSGLNEALAMDNFNRFYSIFPDMEMNADLKTYIFITRPEMNLTSGSNANAIVVNYENTNDNRLQYLAAMNPELLYMLTKDYSNEHDFIPYLQGRAESLQLPDYQIATSDYSVPFYGYKFTYPTVANQSITGGTFDITFREDNDLRVTKLFQFWLYYMDAIIKNKMKPTREHIIDNAYDFMCSVYEIITDPTGERILFWAKYTGCYPTSVPISNLSHNLRSTMDNKVGITFNYIMVEAMEPRVVTDFNNNSRSVNENYDQIYNEEFGMVSDSLVGHPRIELSKDTHALMLKWYKRRKGKTSSINKGSPTLLNINNVLEGRVRRQDNFLEEDTPPAVEVSHSTLSSYMRNNSDRI